MKRLMLYFRSGGIVYGLFYGLRQGLGLLRRWISTAVHRSAVDCGDNCIFYPNVVIFCPDKIQIGNDCLFDSGVSMGSELSSGRLSIGDSVQVNRHVKIDFTGGCKIGDKVLISSGVTILTHSHGYAPRSAPRATGLQIGEAVWIGQDAIILQNVGSVGQNAIVAAGSVVTKAVPPNSVVGGNPAKVLFEIPRQTD